MKLNYAPPPPAPATRRRFANVVLATSLGAPVCLGAAAALNFLLGRGALELQLAFFVTSAVCGALGLVGAIIAIIKNPWGGREIAAITVALTYAALLVFIAQHV